MSPNTIHTLYTIYSDTGIHPGGFMLGRTDYSATQRRRATIFRPATAAAHLTYDRHISERQSLNTIFTRVNPSIRINCVQRAVVNGIITVGIMKFMELIDNFIEFELG